MSKGKRHIPRSVSPATLELWGRATVIQEQYAQRGELISRNRAIKIARGNYRPKKQKIRKSKKSILFRPPSPSAAARHSVFFAKGKSAKIEVLRRYADIKVANPRTPEQIRLEYDATWHKRPAASTQACCVCNGLASCFHHIIQVQNGGGNERQNLVPICDHCHAEIHPWLPKPVHK